MFEVAATEITFGALKLAGYIGRMSLSKPLFPAPATNSMPAALVAMTSSSSACENSESPQLFDSTRISAAPVAANACFTAIANSSAAMASAIVPLPVSSMNLIPIMRAVQLTPATPIPLSPTAPMVPATCVP